MRAGKICSGTGFALLAPTPARLLASHLDRSSWTLRRQVMAGEELSESELWPRREGAHDNRHTLVTELAESGAGDEVIMSIAGHVSRAMLSRYSHVRMEAKRRALDEIAARQCAADEKRQEEAQREQAAVAEPLAVVQ